MTTINGPPAVGGDETQKRPAEVEEDVRLMAQRQRVSEILNSRAFRLELEQIIDSQIQNGQHPAALLALQQIADLMLGNVQPQVAGGRSAAAAGGAATLPRATSGRNGAFGFAGIPIRGMIKTEAFCCSPTPCVTPTNLTISTSHLHTSALLQFHKSYRHWCRFVNNPI